MLQTAVTSRLSLTLSHMLLLCGQKSKEGNDLSQRHTFMRSPVVLASQGGLRKLLSINLILFASDDSFPRASVLLEACPAVSLPREARDASRRQTTSQQTAAAQHEAGRRHLLREGKCQLQAGQ